MSAKIAAFVITFLILLAAGVAIFFAMLVAMNGYSESDATYGFAAYIVLAFAVSLAMALQAFLTAGALLKRGKGGPASAVIAILIFSAVGVVLKLACCIIGVGIAEFARVNF